MAILSYLDCSTSHLSKQDAEKLNAAPRDKVLYSADTIIRRYDEGWFITLLPEGWPTPDDVLLSADYLILVAYARGRGCSLIRLDADGDVLPEEQLPSFDW